jgi:hypothetical protein
MPWLSRPESLRAPVERENDFPSVRIQRSHPFASFRLALSYRKCAFDQVEITPAQLLISHPRIVILNASVAAQAAFCHSGRAAATRSKRIFSS